MKAYIRKSKKQVRNLEVNDVVKIPQKYTKNSDRDIWVVVEKIDPFGNDKKHLYGRRAHLQEYNVLYELPSRLKLIKTIK